MDHICWFLLSSWPALSGTAHLPNFLLWLAAAEAAAWRHHTWTDSVAKFFLLLLPRTPSVQSLVPPICELNIAASTSSNIGRKPHPAHVSASVSPTMSGPDEIPAVQPYDRLLAIRLLSKVSLEFLSFYLALSKPLSKTYVRAWTSCIFWTVLNREVKFSKFDV